MRVLQDVYRVRGLFYMVENERKHTPKHKMIQLCQKAIIR